MMDYNPALSSSWKGTILRVLNKEHLDMAHNHVQRPDGQVSAAVRPRGKLLVCSVGCCCGHVEKGVAPVDIRRYQVEWERRRLGTHVHLYQSGCLGPCQQANVVLLLFEGHPVWFHSLDSAELITALYDYLELLIAAPKFVPPTELLASCTFNRGAGTIR